MTKFSFELYCCYITAQDVQVDVGVCRDACIIEWIQLQFSECNPLSISLGLLVLLLLAWVAFLGPVCCIVSVFRGWDECLRLLEYFNLIILIGQRHVDIAQYHAIYTVA